MGHQAANQQENKPINYTFASAHSPQKLAPSLCYLHKRKWRKEIYIVCLCLFESKQRGGRKGHLKDCFGWNPFPSSSAALCGKTCEKRNLYGLFEFSVFALVFLSFYFSTSIFTLNYIIFWLSLISSNPPCVQYRIVSSVPRERKIDLR